MSYQKGDRVRCKYFPDVTGTVQGEVDLSTPAPTVPVTVDKQVLDMEAGETAPIALDELIPIDDTSQEKEESLWNRIYKNSPQMKKDLEALGFFLG